MPTAQHHIPHIMAFVDTIADRVTVGVVAAAATSSFWLDHLHAWSGVAADCVAPLTVAWLATQIIFKWASLVRGKAE